MPVGRVLNQMTWVFLEEYLSIRNYKLLNLLGMFIINLSDSMELSTLIPWPRQMKEVGMGELEQHVKMADITWKTKWVRWNHVIIGIWELRRMIIDRWGQRSKLQMKHQLRTGKKQFDLPFSCAILSEKRKEKIHSKEAGLYRGSVFGV